MFPFSSSSQLVLDFGIRPLSGTPLVSVSVGNPPAASEDSSALAMASFIIRLASDWDGDDPAYDPRLRFEDSDTGDEGDDEIFSTSHSDSDWTAPGSLLAGNLDKIDNNDVSSPLEDSPVS